jgi:hypothetical protein
MYMYMVMTIALAGFTAATIEVASAAIINRTYSPPLQKSAWYKRKPGAAHQIVTTQTRRGARTKNDFANLNR